MDTDRLIKTLAADNARRAAPMQSAWAMAGFASLIIAAFVFFAAIGPRADIATAATTPRFLFKFVVTLALFATAFVALQGACKTRRLHALGAAHPSCGSGAAAHGGRRRDDGGSRGSVERPAGSATIR